MSCDRPHDGFESIERLLGVASAEHESPPDLLTRGGKRSQELDGSRQEAVGIRRLETLTAAA